MNIQYVKGNGFGYIERAQSLGVMLILVLDGKNRPYATPNYGSRKSKSEGN